jgi:class 3 adenylate cyclase
VAQIDFKWLWLSAFVVSALLVFGNQKLSSVDFLDRHWLETKQSVARHPNFFIERYPSPSVALMELRYTNGVQFWFDDKTRKDLSEKLLRYQSPFIINLDPEQMLHDRYMSKVFDNPNFIRPFSLVNSRSTRNILDAFEREEVVSRSIEQERQGQFRLPKSSLGQVVPADLDYFKRAHFAGALNFSLSNFIYAYSLTVGALRLKVPSMALPAVAALKKCQSYFFKKDGDLELINCKGANETIHVSDPMPLFFYSRPIRRFTPEKIPELTETVLIIDLVSEGNSNALSTFVSNDSSWGEIVATAISNLYENHFPWRNLAVTWIEGFTFVFLSFCIFFAAQRKKLAGTLQVIGLSFLIMLVVDFISTTIFNIRTEPIETGFAIFGLSVIAISTRALIDLRERGIIEKALSGYVSDRRLQRLVSGKEKLALEGRKAELTTLILDIVQFSRITESLAVEEVFHLMQKFFSIVDPIIFKYDGFIDKKTGDGLLAIFGDSQDVTPEAAADKAVRAGLEIQLVLAETSPHLFRLQKGLSLRIGINTGFMMIGNTGSKRHFSYTVLGEAVNFAQRLEAACPDSGVLVGELTAKYVGEKFHLVPTPITIKHDSRPYTAYLLATSDSNIKQLRSR